MPEPEEKQVETTEEKPVEKQEDVVETTETKAEETAEYWRKRYENKQDEAARLHKKVEKFEADDIERKKAAMTEMEKLQAERDEALQKAKELETKQAQRDAAEKTGLPLVFANRLQGATPEELEADAKQLLESMPKSKGGKPLGGMAPVEAEQHTVTDADRRKFLFG